MFAHGEAGDGKVTVFVADLQDDSLRESIEKNATAGFSELNKAFSLQTEPSYQGFESAETYRRAVRELWRSAPFYVDAESLILRVSQLTDGRYEMRDIPITMINDSGENHMEEAVALFSASGTLIDFRIALPLHRYNALLRQGLDVTDVARRQHILAFIEQFRTSYNRKDLPFIEQVFSDQALIIVGHVVEATGETSPFESQVQYMRFSKDEYLERLARVFSRNEWIDIVFDDISIVRHPRMEYIYGVSLVQYYSSATYSDDGYLFLLIDFRQDDQPLIHVRTWQPRYVTPETEVFSLGDLDIF
ncbi:MAG: hypothetical protein LAT67_08880 [Balneolales bacterium]|nr:hypothetical protein [Balneolales bacterium]